MTHTKRSIQQTSLSLVGSMALLVACAGSGTDNGGKGGSSGTPAGGSSGTPSGGSSGTPSGGSSGTPSGGSSGTPSGGSSGTPTGGSSGTPATGGLATMGGFYMTGGLAGYWWTASDPSSMITPKEFGPAAQNICVMGTAAMVQGTDYATTWGTLLGYNVKQAVMPPNDPETMALSANGTIAIGLSGQVPTGTRLKVSVGGTDYCKEISSGMNTVKLSDLKKQCWTPGGTAYGGEAVKDIAVQVSTNATSATPFNFCVTSFSYSM
jgi:hypothetical protein